MNFHSKEIDAFQAKLVNVDDERSSIRIAVNDPNFRLERTFEYISRWDSRESRPVTRICEIKLHGWLYQAYEDSAIGWNIEIYQIEFGVWGGEVGEVGEVRELPVNSEAQQKKLSRVNGCE